LGRGGYSESTPRRSPMPLLSSPFLPPRLPHRLGSPTLGVEATPNPHLGEAPCLFSPPLSFLLALPHRLGSPTLGVEATPNPHLGEAPCLSLLPLFFLSSPSPPPRLLGLGGVEALRNPHLGEAPCLFSSPLSSSSPSPTALGSPTLGVEAAPNPHLGEAPCLFSPPPFLPPRPPHRLAPRPWAWRLLRIHT
jgi:hypothetical protein